MSWPHQLDPKVLDAMPTIGMASKDEEHLCFMQFLSQERRF